MTIGMRELQTSGIASPVRWRVPTQRRDYAIDLMIERMEFPKTYQPSPYVRWFLPHVLAWEPNVTAREAIHVCFGFYQMGQEIGQALKLTNPDIAEGAINMGLAPDSVRISRSSDGLKTSLGYRFTRERDYPYDAKPADKLLAIGFWIGFHHLTW